MCHRLWFRLDDVLPLAEHALACSGHRLTGAQAQARAASGPALIWTRTPTADQLTSNGTPLWYGPHGALHTADALTWRGPGARRGTGRIEDYRSGYLPLTDHRLIDLLHLAAVTNRNWITIDIDPADEHLIHADRISAIVARHDLVPAGARWIPATVTCRDVDDEPYPALIADGYTSDDGALLARFDLATVRRISDDLAYLSTNPARNSDSMPGEYPTLQLREGGELVVRDEQDTGDEPIWHITDRVTPDSDGLYPLGAYLWPWRLVSRPRGWRARLARLRHWHSRHLRRWSRSRHR